MRSTDHASVIKRIQTSMENSIEMSTTCRPLTHWTNRNASFVRLQGTYVFRPCNII